MIIFSKIASESTSFLVVSNTVAKYTQYWALIKLYSNIWISSFSP